jgi:hypothetical protein
MLTFLNTLDFERVCVAEVVVERSEREKRKEKRRRCVGGQTLVISSPITARTVKSLHALGLYRIRRDQRLLGKTQRANLPCTLTPQ